MPNFMLRWSREEARAGTQAGQKLEYGLCLCGGSLSLSGAEAMVSI